MLEASRRSFITGLVALVAAPAIVRAGSLMPVNSGLVPSGFWINVGGVHRGIERLEVLYGKLQIRPEWLTIEAEERLRLPDPAVVMEDARRMYSFNSEADRKRFYANWESNYAFMQGEQWDKAWYDESAGLLERQADINVRHGQSSQIPDSLALAAAAVAVAPVVLAKPVTRRFWGK